MSLYVLEHSVKSLKWEEIRVIVLYFLSGLRKIWDSSPVCFSRLWNEPVIKWLLMFIFNQIQHCRSRFFQRPTVVLDKKHTAACAGVSSLAGGNTLRPVQRPGGGDGEEERHRGEGQSHVGQQEDGFTTPEGKSGGKQRHLYVRGPAGWAGLSSGIQFEGTDCMFCVILEGFIYLSSLWKNVFRSCMQSMYVIVAQLFLPLVGVNKCSYICI